uniref:Chromosome 15 open reading frame 52 n=1 Tax=Nothobranchius kadleci TaxID=1051664 RepID=A0A1A8D3B2_NOTKA
MERPTTSDMLPRRDHERDLELDKKIEALRRKNEALMKRYKEVEEDKKKAEVEGMALQSSKGKADDLIVTISKSTEDGRVVVTKPLSSGSSPEKGQQEPRPDRVGESPVQGSGRGHRKQLTVTMTAKKGKRVVSERAEKRPGSSDLKSPACDGKARSVESTGRGKQTSQSTRKETSSSSAAAAAAAAQEEVNQGQRPTEEQSEAPEQCQESENLQTLADLNVPTSREEQEEYLRWKKEREQIDRERVARHKNDKGQWRRAWDVDKTESMFSDKCLPARDWGPSSRGGRSVKRGQQKAGSDSKGHGRRGKDKAAKNVLVMSSKAKGKDRLTGRARRWQDNDDGENQQTSDTTLVEFLEERDALTDANKQDLKDQDSKAKPDPESAAGEASVSDGLREENVTQKKAESSPSRGVEKKVRFSEDLIQAAAAKQSSLDSADSKGPFKASSPKKNQHGSKPSESAKQDYGSSQDKGGGRPAPPVVQKQETEKIQANSNAPPTNKPCACLHKSLVQPVEVSKCNSSSPNTEELRDSSLSVLRMESGETHPTHSASSDKAREHGKIV